LIEGGRAAEALPLFEDLVRIDVRNESAWVGLAAARFESGAAGPATSTAIEGLLFFPGSTELVIIAARATAVVGDGDDGRTVLARLQSLASEKDPLQAADLLAHGALLAHSVDAQSTDLAAQAIALDPGNRLALALVGAKSAADGDADRARAYLGRMQLPGARDWEAAEAAAHAYLALGDQNLSGQMFVLAASGPYASRSVLLAAARAYADLGDEGSADALLSRARADSTTVAEPRNKNEQK
jgi:hypothetical protein